MKKFANSIKKFIQSEDGPTAVEYAVMVALIIIVCIGAVDRLGDQINTTFTNIETELSTRTGAAGS